MNNESTLKGILADVFGVGADTIDDDTSVDTVEGWDSLKHMNLILALEAGFDVTFTEEQTVEILNYPLIKAVLGELGITFSHE